jgi:hypothetical protein
MASTFDRADCVYGGDDVARRCVAWAHANQFKLLRRTRYCEHILRRVKCPATRDNNFYPRDCIEILLCHDVFDHGRVWERVDKTRFLLSHVYGELPKTLDMARELARKKSLIVRVDWSMDWYSPGHTIPLRFDPITSN